MLPFFAVRVFYFSRSHVPDLTAIRVLCIPRPQSYKHNDDNILAALSRELIVYYTRVFFLFLHVFFVYYYKLMRTRTKIQKDDYTIQ